jgi:hypothetical protein
LFSHEKKKYPKLKQGANGEFEVDDKGEGTLTSKKLKSDEKELSYSKYKIG